LRSFNVPLLVHTRTATASKGGYFSCQVRLFPTRTVGNRNNHRNKGFTSEVKLIEEMGVIVCTKRDVLMLNKMSFERDF